MASTPYGQSIVLALYMTVRGLKLACSNECLYGDTLVFRTLPLLSLNRYRFVSGSGISRVSSSHLR